LQPSVFEIALQEGHCLESRRAAQTLSNSSIYLCSFNNRLFWQGVFLTPFLLECSRDDNVNAVYKDNTIQKKSRMNHVYTT
jgi:hypothetical protein